MYILCMFRLVLRGWPPVLLTAWRLPLESGCAVLPALKLLWISGWQSNAFSQPWTGSISCSIIELLLRIIVPLKFEVNK
jgi:hypothetical protein